MNPIDYYGIPPDDLSEGERTLWQARRLNSQRLRNEARAMLRHEGNTEALRDLDDEEESIAARYYGARRTT